MSLDDSYGHSLVLSAPRSIESDEEEDNDLRELNREELQQQSSLQHEEGGEDWSGENIEKLENIDDLDYNFEGEEQASERIQSDLKVIRQESTSKNIQQSYHEESSSNQTKLLQREVPSDAKQYLNMRKAQTEYESQRKQEQHYSEEDSNNNINVHEVSQQVYTDEEEEEVDKRMEISEEHSIQRQSYQQQQISNCRSQSNSISVNQFMDEEAFLKQYGSEQQPSQILATQKLQSAQVVEEESIQKAEFQEVDEEEEQIKTAVISNCCSTSSNNNINDNSLNNIHNQYSFHPINECQQDQTAKQQQIQQHQIVEGISDSKHIELTPRQMFMISTSQQKQLTNSEQLQESAETDLVNEVAFYIFGRRLFRKLRQAYVLKFLYLFFQQNLFFQTENFSHSSLATKFKISKFLLLFSSFEFHFDLQHLTKDLGASKRRREKEEERLNLLKNCFQTLVERMVSQRKKKQMQERVFGYYEKRYIRRPLNGWKQLSLVRKAQRVSIEIIFSASEKTLLIQGMEGIKSYLRKIKRQQTVGKLLQIYDNKKIKTKGSTKQEQQKRDSHCEQDRDSLQNQQSQVIERYQRDDSLSDQKNYLNPHNNYLQNGFEKENDFNQANSDQIDYDPHSTEQQHMQQQQQQQQQQFNCYQNPQYMDQKLQQNYQKEVKQKQLNTINQQYSQHHNHQQDNLDDTNSQSQKQLHSYQLLQQQNNYNFQGQAPFEEDRMSSLEIANDASEKKRNPLIDDRNRNQAKSSQIQSVVQRSTGSTGRFQDKQEFQSKKLLLGENQDYAKINGNLYEKMSDRWNESNDKMTNRIFEGSRQIKEEQSIYSNRQPHQQTWVEKSPLTHNQSQESYNCAEDTLLHTKVREQRRAISGYDMQTIDTSLIDKPSFNPQQAQQGRWNYQQQQQQQQDNKSRLLPSEQDTQKSVSSSRREVGKIKKQFVSLLEKSGETNSNTKSNKIRVDDKNNKINEQLELQAIQFNMKKNQSKSRERTTSKPFEITNSKPFEITNLFYHPNAQYSQPQYQLQQHHSSTSAHPFEDTVLSYKQVNLNSVNQPIHQNFSTKGDPIYFQQQENITVPYYPLQRETRSISSFQQANQQSQQQSSSYLLNPQRNRGGFESSPFEQFQEQKQFSHLEQREHYKQDQTNNWNNQANKHLQQPKQNYPPSPLEEHIRFTQYSQRVADAAASQIAKQQQNYSIHKRQPSPLINKSFNNVMNTSFNHQTNFSNGQLSSNQNIQMQRARIISTTSQRTDISDPNKSNISIGNISGIPPTPPPKQAQKIAMKGTSSINQVNKSIGQYNKGNSYSSHYQQQQNRNNVSHNNSINNTSLFSHNNNNNHTNNTHNNSISEHESIKLSEVGQNIQNILYFEAKIRSKRIARSQERAKNESMELCKKLEHLESYLGKINEDLQYEKQRKGDLVQENRYLRDNSFNCSKMMVQ